MDFHLSDLNETCLGSNLGFYNNWLFITIYGLETYMYSQLSFPIEFVGEILCELIILNIKFMVTAKNFQIDQSDHCLVTNSQSTDELKESIWKLDWEVLEYLFLWKSDFQYIWIFFSLLLQNHNFYNEVLFLNFSPLESDLNPNWRNFVKESLDDLWKEFWAKQNYYNQDDPASSPVDHFEDSDVQKFAYTIIGLEEMKVCNRENISKWMIIHRFDAVLKDLGWVTAEFFDEGVISPWQVTLHPEFTAVHWM